MTMPTDWNRPSLRCPPTTSPLVWERMDPWQQLDHWRAWNTRMLKEQRKAARAARSTAPRNPVRPYAVRSTSLV